MHHSVIVNTLVYVRMLNTGYHLNKTGCLKERCCFSEIYKVYVEHVRKIIHFTENLDFTCKFILGYYF